MRAKDGRWLPKPSAGTVLGGLALIIAASGIAYSAIPSADGTISACYSNGKGNLRIIDAEAGQACGSGETAISWKTGTNAAGGDLAGAYPNPTIRNSAVGSGTIRDGAITRVDLAANSVNSNKVVDDSLDGQDVFEPGLAKVPNADRLDGSDSSGFVREGDLRLSDQRTPLDDSVTSAKVLNGALRLSDLAVFAFTTTYDTAGTLVHGGCDTRSVSGSGVTVLPGDVVLGWLPDSAGTTPLKGLVVKGGTVTVANQVRYWICNIGVESVADPPPLEVRLLAFRPS